MYRFAENLKSDNTFLCHSGSTALCLLLMSMGIGPGDEVILQSFTCPAVPASVAYVGATPAYVDIDPITFNMAPAKLEVLITRKTRAIIVQHTFGIPAEMERILAIVRKYDLKLIEDACHALGSKYAGQEVGEFGDAAIYSFGWYKPIVLGVGGAAVVNNPTLRLGVQAAYKDMTTPSVTSLVSLYVQSFAYTSLLSPRWFWLMKEIYRRQRDFRRGPRKGRMGPLLFGYTYPSNGKSHRQTTQDQERVGSTRTPGQLSQPSPIAQRNSSTNAPLHRMAPFQEERLFRKLDQWDRVVERQAQLVSQYRRSLAQIGYAPAELNSRLEPVYYKYPLLVDQKKGFFEQAQKAGIEVSDMFGSPLYPLERRATWQTLGYKPGMCPAAEYVSDRIVALPIHAKVEDANIKRVVALLASRKV